MKDFLRKINWVHAAGLAVSLAAAATSELFGIKHTATVAVALGLLTRLDKILSKSAV